MKTMKTMNEKTLSGSIVLERGTSFLARQIILHMAILARRTDREPLKYSHAETLIWNDKERKIILTDNRGVKTSYLLEQNTMYTVGARGKGCEISKAADYYGKHEILILKPKIPLTDEQISALWVYFKIVDPTRYQYGNFLSWINYIKTGRWIANNNDKVNYCYKLAAKFSNRISLWPRGKSTDMVSIYDLYENPNYEIYSEDKKK